MDLTRHLDAVLFDKDGTLFDFAKSWSAWAVRVLDELAGGDPELADALGRAMSFDRATGRFSPDSVVIAGTPEDVAGLIAPVLGTEPDALVEVLNGAAAAAPMVEAVPLAPLLEDLRSGGLKLGVATNDGAVPARAHLEGAGVFAAFDFVAGSDSGWTPKPAPDMCLAFAEAMGVAPARVAMVGDSLHDLHAGRAAGMATVGVLTGPAEAAHLEGHADVVLPDIGHLPGWLSSGTRMG
ncbi:HAD-IA family hydrolase [Maritimibacter sp. DP07]|uniref:phosphoglycolate phosphatase n=1 Tax=Maritimibacter harenae TaxID=2606218 RepID=A0A845M5Y0_9RHOB|nr:HAD family hydrolase [Maritimibacter harenae]MZR11774.1 HAD-IA family hydrolase [Maritimibacter harenae]